MGAYGYHVDKHCRWCGTSYNAAKPHDRDGFCCAKCKQAHYRAYKAYVTQAMAVRGQALVKPVTQKKEKTDARTK